MPRLVEVFDRHGKKRIVDLADPKNIVEDGGQVVVPMILMDTSGATFTSADTNDAGDPFRITDQMRQARDSSRTEMVQRLTNAWRGPENQPIPLADGAGDAVQRSREARAHYVTNAWRTGGR